ncbi:MAG: metal ABC transporter ATP-binding protein [bacterium]|nr:metal ABC transporter ATP-binding protein [bacterium]
MDPVLSVKNLNVTLDGNHILEGVDLSLNKGESLAIIGPNGSGKTILLKSMLGIVPYKGAITWAPGVRIGYVPQKIDADRHLPMNLADLLNAKMGILKLPSSAIRPAIDTVGLSEKILTTPIGHLSGGQFQKALIALAILGEPNVLLLDEPTASIDNPGEEQIYELVHRLQDELGITTITVSHDLSFVYRYATQVLCLNQRNVCFGKPEDVLTPENLEKLYGTPHKFYHHLESDPHIHPAP